MASASSSRIIHSPGTVIVNPTQAFSGGTYPYGGKILGKTNACVLQLSGTAFRVEYESLGEAGDILEPNNSYQFGCFFRGWDDDAVEEMLASGFETGAVTQHAVWHSPGNVTPGASTIQRAVILVYVPDNLIDVPAILIYRGIPEFTEGAEMSFQRVEELGLALTVDCLRDANDNILRVGRLPDLSLT